MLHKTYGIFLFSGVKKRKIRLKAEMGGSFRLVQCDTWPKNPRIGVPSSKLSIPIPGILW